ncbi:MAG: hypothetical protein V4466_00910 [Pseudomonadota bacterium]
MRPQPIFAWILVLFGLVGCGPKTVVSALSPLKYAVTTTVEFQDHGATTRQAIVTRCRVIDQTDSVSGNYAIDETGDVHWFKRSDGSLWLLRRFETCRWREAAPPAGEAPRSLSPGAGADPSGSRLQRTLVYRLDNAENPTQLDIHDTDALFGPGIDGLSARAELAPGGGAATDVLRKVFPWLGGPQGAAAPGRVFRGYVAEVRQLPATVRCPSPNPGAAGPVLLSGPPNIPACTSTPTCMTRQSPATTACAVGLGSLRPTFDPGYRTVRFGDPGRAERYGGTLVRGTILRAAGAEGLTGQAGDMWKADVCVEGVCVRLDRMQTASVYYPARNLLVTLHYDEAEPSSGWLPS